MLLFSEISQGAEASVKQRVMQTLQMKGASTKVVRDVVREYASNLGGDTELEQEYIMGLVDKF